MSIADLGALGEFLGSFIVAITVIVLIWQVRQNTSALESAAEYELSRAFGDLHGKTADRELSELFVKVQANKDNLDELTDLELARYRWWASEIFYIVESAYKRYHRGHLSDETWETYLDTVLSHLDNEIVSTWWDLEMSPFLPDFRKLVNEARAKSEPTRLQVPLGTERGT